MSLRNTLECLCTTDKRRGGFIILTCSYLYKAKILILEIHYSATVCIISKAERYYSAPTLTFTCVHVCVCETHTGPWLCRCASKRLIYRLKYPWKQDIDFSTNNLALLLSSCAEYIYPTSASSSVHPGFKNNLLTANHIQIPNNCFTLKLANLKILHSAILGLIPKGWSNNVWFSHCICNYRQDKDGEKKVIPLKSWPMCTDCQKSMHDMSIFFFLPPFT